MYDHHKEIDYVGANQQNVGTVIQHLLGQSFAFFNSCAKVFIFPSRTKGVLN